MRVFRLPEWQLPICTSCLPFGIGGYGNAKFTQRHTCPVMLLAWREEQASRQCKSISMALDNTSSQALAGVYGGKGFQWGIWKEEAGIRGTDYCNTRYIYYIICIKNTFWTAKQIIPDAGQ